MRKNMERNSRLGFFAAVYSVIFVCGDSVANAGYFDKIAFRVIFVGIVFFVHPECHQNFNRLIQIVICRYRLYAPLVHGLNRLPLASCAESSVSADTVTRVTRIEYHFTSG